MRQKYLMRYVLFAVALLLCAGAAWYMADTAAGPQGDAVLAYLNDPAVQSVSQKEACAA